LPVHTRTVPGAYTVTHFLYDTQYRVLEDRDGSEELVARYTYGSGMDEPLLLEVVAQQVITYHYHRDAVDLQSPAASPR
jgi:hypothetical protein